MNVRFYRIADGSRDVPRIVPGSSGPVRNRGLRLSRYAAAVCIVLFLAPLLSCRQRLDWIKFRGEQGQGLTRNAVFPPLGVKWKLRLQTDGPAAYAFNNPVVKDGTVLFGSTDGNFYSLDIESGYMNWVFKTGASINSIPFADDRNVYFGSNDGKLYALSLSDGKELWSYYTGRTVQSTIMRYRDHVIFASDGGKTYFLTPEGEEEFTLPNPVWYYNSFQVYRDVMYFAPGPMTQPHSFGAYDLKLRKYLWILDTAAMNAHWYSFSALDGDLLFMSTSTDRYSFWEFAYYAFDRSTGDIVWVQHDLSRMDFELKLPVMSDKNYKLIDYLAPAVWRNLVVYTSGDNVVRAFDKRTGAIEWEHEFDVPTSSSPVIAGDRLYFGLEGDTDGSFEEGVYGRKPRLVCLSAKNGRLMWELETDGSLLSAPVVSGKWMIFGTDENYFYVLEELTG